ncbi:protein TolQ [Persicimonas caeni]|uniref:Protein TolQ n=1 Tax=Persicimonas caeni TaxID=2292766 RepID=A0A4Y6Q1B6_PERCE|nr:protein TolQ [Persicimonas caeni]QDG54302.1 protein TolQ [Persicimonas caeni]QED35523.1 protein TolQ [Persicimonas caeni]
MWDAIWVNLVTAQAEAAKEPTGIVDILMETSGVVLGVLLLLAALSVISWYIIGYKWFYLRKVRNESLKFLDVFWQSKRLDAIYQSAEEFANAPVSQVFKAGYIELSKLKNREKPEGNDSMKVHLSGIENVDRALRRATSSEMTHLESMVPFLATVGSTAPFIGLFGTVWGIMIAFVNIEAAGAAGIDVVAAPIAEALIVTAAGLFAAIPAVVFYNLFVNRIKVLGAEMENFSNDFLNIVKRHFFD